MMNPDEPAFPAEWVAPDEDCGQSRMWYAKGITKREYFAAMAMQGIISSGQLPEKKTGQESRDWLSHTSCLIADALIAELSK